MKIDFDAKDTEAGWQARLDKFWLAATPQWFDWVGWLLIMGALTFVSQETLNIAVKIIVAISYGLLLMYFGSYFYQFEFINLPFVKRYPKVARVTSLAISGLLFLGTYFLIRFSIADFASTGSN